MNNVVIIIQNVTGLGYIERKCIDSLEKRFVGIGIDLHIIDVSSIDDLGYIDNVMHYLSQNPQYRYVGFAFDDIFFENGNAVGRNEIQEAFSEYNLDYLRFNARPYPHGDKIGNDLRLIDCTQKYGLSVVTSFFSVSLLEKLREAGRLSAWDIETCTNINYRGAAKTSMNYKYHNIIVKGKIDLIPLLRSKFHIPIKKSVLRFAQKLCIDSLRKTSSGDAFVNWLMKI